ncbi:alpha/beta fold hydrolase [Amorphus sp. MBR-141]
MAAEATGDPATGLAGLRRGSGAPLVLVHGYLGGAGMWRREVERFSHRFDVIAPDLAGYGARAAEPSPDTIAGHARDIIARLDGLGIARFHLLGHSMGGMIAQEVAAHIPDRIDRLVLYGTGPRGVLPDRFEPIETSRRRLRADGVPDTARRIAATWFVDGEAAAAFPVCAALGRLVSEQTALAGLDAMETWDGRAGLARIAAPTLVLWGDRDRSYAWPQPEALWRGIAGASLAVVPGCAHNVHQEKPHLFEALVADFLLPSSSV